MFVVVTLPRRACDRSLGDAERHTYRARSSEGHACRDSSEDYACRARSSEGYVCRGHKTASQPQMPFLG